MFRVFGVACFVLLAMSSCGKPTDSQNRKSTDLDGPSEVNAERLNRKNGDGTNMDSFVH